MAASQGDDSVGAANCPEHPRLFEAGTDHGLAASFDDSRADKEVLEAKLGIAHALGISFKVVRLGANLVDHFGICGNDGTKCEYQLFDFALVEQPPLVDLHPSFLVHFVIGM